MTNIEALNILLNFLPTESRQKLKDAGLYDLILTKKISTGAEIYDYLEEEQASWQDADYSFLADELEKILNQGSVLQIGCGQGDLLMRLAQKNFTPIYGIDRSKIMIEATANKLKNCNDTCLFIQPIETFEFKLLKNINNVIINNFWSIISEEESINLLNNLKKCLDPEGLIIIGPYIEKKSPEKLLALKTLEKNLGFIFSYPFFKDFERCGYEAEVVELGGLRYFVLKNF